MPVTSTGIPPFAHNHRHWIDIGKGISVGDELGRRRCTQVAKIRPDALGIDKEDSLTALEGMRYPIREDDLTTVKKDANIVNFIGECVVNAFNNGMSDLDDMEDMEMIRQQLRYEQSLQEQEAESSNRRNYIYREHDVAEERLMADYFGDHPKYLAYYFRKRYRMSRKLFLEIVAGIETYIQIVDHLLPYSDFFRVRPDATGQPSFSVIMKCISALRQLAYDVTPDALDEYLQMGDHCAHDCLYIFTMCVIHSFMLEFLRKPDFNDIQKLYNTHNMIHGFPRMLESIDCMH
ncbi:ALP1-like protein [Tanacetum coccineum]